ncbi:bifunctional methylenetetrahydrofolate dehydrogenase/methenyltetrahydrofolate cyclohydrolase FolD [Azospirillum soli]|uniref:bifunctional methylenetetrahydrofolate dehydrogenase/methenyltetrahydrofolate cyclohydrolase FolD n=1 Tax=Azospirillum soli TaxID=1304799 RepID=UPI001AEA8DD5|nr:bifunctional methylenetetrahydrofolate dehydrogenase/methenyltetrahydrofolate cyclohydrolase FolD [Azospirillum soli]MBP2311389.1 methylenetetrahydrofolate dehydrogenase (NADP+)/methenyltetrahydrofolate cyclohydrolase [Azospirillum soli]
MAEAKIIDGKAFAAGLRSRVAEGVAALKASHGVTPGLAVVLVGEDPASQVYVRSKERALVELGMNSFDHHKSADMTEADMLALIDTLNADPAVHGILVQLPLPKHMDTQKVLARIAPEKDADGFHVVNAGLLATGSPGATIPCTPLGCLLLIRDVLGRDLSGKRALVIGRSNIVGKPMAQLLLQADCTVTMAHSRTKDLAEECRRADIVVAAVGRAEMVRGDWIKPGAVVIDVGMNRIPAAEEGKTKLVGDVAYDECAKVAGAITPVPGGVGPMTIACLMLNTLTAACRAAGAPVPAEAVA